MMDRRCAGEKSGLLPESGGLLPPAYRLRPGLAFLSLNDGFIGSSGEVIVTRMALT